MSSTAEWTNLEKLLLAQAVYKLGEDNWVQVARNLNQSIMLDRQPDFFNQEDCSKQYSRLVNSIEKTEKQPDSTHTSTDEPAPVVQIARTLYIQRLEELRCAIEETNEKYVTLTNEIDAIRIGKWDEQLLAEEARKNQTIITTPTRAEPTTNDDDEPKAVEEEPTQKDDAVVIETPQPEEGPVQLQQIQEEQTATSTSPAATTTPLSILDSGSAVNTPREQGPVTPVEASVNTPPTPAPPAPATITVPTVTTTEAVVPLATDVAAIMDRIEAGPPELAPAVETRQPETTVVPSVVEEPTPEEALEAVSEPHVTSQPTISAQMLDVRPASEESFHSATTEIKPEVKLEVFQLEQQLPAPSSPSPSPSPPPPPPPAPEEPIEEKMSTTYVMSTDEEMGSGEVTWNNELKRKAEEDAGAVERQEIKRRRTGDDVTQEIAADTVQPNKKPSQEGAEIKSGGMEPILETPELSMAATATTTTARTPHQDADDQAKHEESRSPDAVYPRSPEAPLSMTSGADAESVTGSESNAPTPTGSALSSENKRTGSGSGRSKDEQRQQKSWQKNINLLWREITNHKNGAMFMNPIKEATAPSYYDIVKHPMDLKAIKNRIRDGVIKSTVEFERDIVLMLTNSLMYNKEGTEMYQMALEMLDDVTEQMKLFKTADSNSPPVSHTRKASTIAKDRRKSISDF